MTHVLILTAGSRGDVQPFVALAMRLLAEGFEATVATSESFRDFVEGYGVSFAPLDDELLQLKETPAGQRAFEGKKGNWELMRQAMPMLRRMVDDAWTAAEQCRPDAVLFHPKILAGAHIAEKLRILGIVALPVPFLHSTSDFPNPVLPVPRLGAWSNRMSYRLTPMMSASYAGVTNGWRKEHGLKPVSRFRSDATGWDGRPAPTLVMVSDHVLPRPKDWPPQAVMSGFWMLPEHASWQPPADLEAFLAAGAPPVYIGFGSMTGTRADERARMAVEATTAAGLRAVLATGWGGLAPGDVPETIHVLREAPHAWLFPRMAAVVHHGGAGTTAAGLTAGKPTQVVPFFGDQPFWGGRVEALGVGPEPIPQKRLTAERLAAALRTMTSDEAMRRRAEDLGAKLREEDGTGMAVEYIRQWVGEPVPLPVAVKV